MAYDPAKDKEIKSWKHKDGLCVSVYQYNGGEPKVQIGPRVFTKTNGTTGYGKAGRLTLEEFVWVVTLNQEILLTANALKK